LLKGCLNLPGILVRSNDSALLDDLPEVLCTETKPKRGIGSGIFGFSAF